MIRLSNLMTTSHVQDGCLELEYNVAANDKVSIVDDLHTKGAYKSKIKINLAENSEVKFFAFIEDDSTSNIDKEVCVTLSGERSSAELFCTCLGKANKVINFKSKQHHIGKKTKSNLKIKGVLFDSSKFVSENLIRIEKEASGSNAREENKNLLLGERARAITIPKLEIEANEVSCSHGAAVSKLNEDQIFYLQSRGLDLNEAKSFLINAFLGDIYKGAIYE